MTQDAANFKAGDRVIVYGGGLGGFRDGTWAELVTVPAASLRRLPEGLSFEEGAALPNVGVTAYGALRTAELEGGEALVVLGTKIRDLGADHVVALSGPPLAEQVQKLTRGKGAEAVLDPIGGEATGKALAALASFGRLVHLGYSAGMTLTINSLD